MFIVNVSVENTCTIFRKAAEKNIPAVFPTDTIYGIGAPLSSIEANESIFSIKHRPEGFPFPILAGSIEQVETIAILDELTNEAKSYFKKWPGPYTLILKAKPELPEIYKKNGTVAVRIPGLDWLQSALIKFGQPVTATSVNINKEPPLNDLKEILAQFGDRVSLFINGEAKMRQSSEIYDITGDEIVRLR